MGHHTFLVSKLRHKPLAGLPRFLSRYMILCTISTCIFYLSMLIASGYYTLNSCSVVALPVIYGAIIQFALRIYIK